MITYHVPVFNMDNQPLMPTNLGRAKRWIASRKATPFYKKGLFCVRLNVRTKEEKQPIVIGVDPGSKQEAYTVKSEAHTYVNLQADAVDWVKDSMKTRRAARRGRRFRKTPCRKPRWNRASLKKSRLPPSTKARWQWKIRLINWLKQLFPVTNIIVEDIKARTKGKKAWDVSFSPLQIGKNWFYSLVHCDTKQGYETKKLRDQAGLTKSKNKLSKDFSAHCVDSWVLANSVVGGHIKPENTKVMHVRPIRLHRRQLHVFVPNKSGKRKPYGGTRSMGLKRGSFVKHKELGVTYVGGSSRGRISLHAFDGKRLGRSFHVGDCKFLCFSSWVC